MLRRPNINSSLQLCLACSGTEESDCADVGKDAEEIFRGTEWPLEIYDPVYCSRYYERIVSELSLCHIFNLEFCEDLPSPPNRTDHNVIKVNFPRRDTDQECQEAKFRRQSQQRKEDNLGFTVAIAILGTIVANIALG